MIKSVTIKDIGGKIVLKVICHKNGEYEIVKDKAHEWMKIEVRNENNQKLYNL